MDRYRTRDEGHGRRDSFVFRLVALVVIFVTGWLVGVWSQTNRFALPLLETIPWTEKLTRAFHLADDHSRLTAERLQGFQQTLSRVEAASTATSQDQTALRNSLSAVQDDLVRIQANLDALRRRYDESLDDISGEIGLQLDALRRKNEMQPVNKPR
ncbi:hypothetical protein [Bradyrhizobium sp. AZCC 1708]|uniref:hypothetical protein n=1 Tax=Bradyrhizobium sp. AZCC 1708 TaxID=3117015 RepID=UPI002FEFA20F